MCRFSFSSISQKCSTCGVENTLDNEEKSFSNPLAKVFSPHNPNIFFECEQSSLPLPFMSTLNATNTIPGSVNGSSAPRDNVVPNLSIYLSILSGTRTLNPFAVEFIPNVMNILVGVEISRSHIETNRLNPHAKLFFPSNIDSFIVASQGNIENNPISFALPLNVPTPPEYLSVDSISFYEVSAGSPLRDSVKSDTDLQLSSSSNLSVEDEEGSAYAILNNIRVNNINKILIGHLNINSIRNKFDLLVDLVKDKLDIILISETKIDSSFPNSQFEIQGYSSPHRLDRNEHGGGLLLYTRGDIHTKPLPLVSESIECVILEIIIAKKKWLVFGLYNPDVKTIKTHLSAVGKNLDHYLPSYDNLVLLGDFNCEMKEEILTNFCSLYDLSCLVKGPTCFKNAENPSSIDLIDLI